MPPAWSLVLDLLIVAAIGGVAGLDRRGAFQALVSQPVVVLPVLGLIFGQLEVGLQLGALVQLLWLSSHLFGATVPPNESVAAVVIGGIVMLHSRYGGVSDLTTWATAILVGAPASFLGRAVEIRIDRANLDISKRADASAKAGEPGVLVWLTYWALLRASVAHFVVIVPMVLVGLLVLSGLRLTYSGPMVTALAVVGAYVLPALGLAVGLTTLRRRRSLAIAGGTFVVTLLAMMQARGS